MIISSIGLSPFETLTFAIGDLTNNQKIAYDPENNVATVAGFTISSTALHTADKITFADNI